MWTWESPLSVLQSNEDNKPLVSSGKKNLLPNNGFGSKIWTLVTTYPTDTL